MLLSLLFGFSAASETVASVDQWLALVKSHSLEIRSQNERLKVSERNKSAAFGSLFPKVDLQSSMSLDHLDKDVNEGKTSLGSLSVTANLYRSHLDWYEYKIAQDLERIANLNYTKEVGDLLVRAVSLYLDYSNRAVDLDIAKERLRLVNEQFGSTRRAFQSGTGTKLNFLRLEAEKIAAEFSVDRTQSELLKAESEMRALIANPTEPFTLTAQAFDQNFKIDPVAVPTDAKAHFEYQIENLQTRIAGTEVSKAQRNYWPNVDLTTSYARSVNTFWGPSAEVWESDLATTLNVSFNLFDGGVLAKEVANRRSDLIIQENQAQSLELELNSRLIQLKEDSERLNQQVQIALRVLSIETQVYRAIANEYRLGNSTYLDFINSLNKLLSARQNLQASAADYVRVIYRIKYNRGELR